MNINGESLKRERKQDSIQETGHRDKVMVRNIFQHISFARKWIRM